MMTYLTACREYQEPVLLRSMIQHCKPFVLHVLCWDWTPPIAGHGVNGEWEVRYITRAQFLAQHPEYESLPGPPRRTINLIDTARWRVIADLVREGMGPVVYVDGDQWFFSSIQPILDEVRGAKLAVSPHRIPPAAMGLPGVTLETHRKYGLYNSGFSVVSDLEIAEEMAAAVYQWSYSSTIEYPSGVYYFGDQGHLEQLAARANAHVIQHPGVNVAPWNVHRYRLTKTHNGKLFVDGVPLVTYHYSGLRWNDDGSLAQLFNSEYAVTNEQQRLLYDPYLAEVNRARR